MVVITTVDESVRSLICRALAGLGLCALAGCAVSNEGAVDYRKAEILRPATGAPPIRIAGIAPGAGPEDTVVQAQAPQTSIGPVAPARLPPGPAWRRSRRADRSTGRRC